jgi:hypothetical protein
MPSSTLGGMRWLDADGRCEPGKGAMGIAKDSETPALVAVLVEHHYERSPAFRLELVRLLLKQLERDAAKHGYEATSKAIGVGVRMTADVVVAVQALEQDMRAGVKASGSEHTNIDLEHAAEQRSAELEALGADIDAEERLGR